LYPPTALPKKRKGSTVSEMLLKATFVQTPSGKRQQACTKE